MPLQAALLFLIVWPVWNACGVAAVGSRSPRLRRILPAVAVLGEAAVAGALFVAPPAGAGISAVGFGGLGLSLTWDGLRSVFVLLAAFLWLMTTLFSRDYLREDRHLSRYLVFLLLTLGATMGFFLSGDLFAAYAFFEILSFASFVWVAHEETPAALQAGRTYLAVAVFSGLLVLMGLLLVYSETGTLQWSALSVQSPSLSGKPRLYLAGGCLLLGFGAKAGMFPLHIWLPQAHPVAPAPASALLSGILTKTGLFGVLLITATLFRGDMKMGWAILLLGTATMVVGAVLALFSIDFKRLLACSSISQVGFVLLGLGLYGMCGENGTIAAAGSLTHMVNHALFKLLLFLGAGVVTMNVSSTKLNDIRGFGRGKPLFSICMSVGMLGLGGVPLFSGYLSKTLLHDALRQAAGTLSAGGSFLPAVLDGTFLFTGGLTVAYLLKLFVALFVDKGPAEASPAGGRYWSRLGAFTLVVPALCLLLLGLCPSVFTALFSLGASAWGLAELPSFPFFTADALLSAGISLVIGGVVYGLVVRRGLMQDGPNGQRVYVDRWPPRLSLETLVYRPLVRARCFGTVCRVLSDLTDGLVVALRKTLLRPQRPTHGPARKHPVPYALGTAVDQLLSITQHKPRARHRFALFFTRISQTLRQTTHRIAGTFSFGLLMACVGICLALMYILLFVVRG